jgi:hypothetical protein
MGIGRDVPPGKGYGRAAHHGVVFHHAPGDGSQAVRSLKLLLDTPDGVSYGSFHLVHYAQDVQFGGFQLAFGAAVGFLCDRIFGIYELQETGHLHREEGNHYYQQALPGGLPLSFV